ncbi:MAG: DUF4143 domain-containing protein [Methanocalculaceae archaeon]|jgi:predicted AAA+ superfamily ATPase|nr:DUF4143 domain-containing protein [Methanocalculaceae archaeon]
MSVCVEKHGFSNSSVKNTLPTPPTSTLKERVPRICEEPLTENYVLAELIATNIPQIIFWKSGNRAKVDFVVLFGVAIVPVEVKTA